MVVQNASKIWLWYLLNSSTWASYMAPARLLVDGRRCRCGNARGTEVLVPRRLPRAFGLHLCDRVVDLGPQFGVTLLQADAVALLGERPADDLERARALCRVAGQDHLVGGHRVNRAVLQRLDARRIRVVLLQLHPGVLVLDALCWRRSRNRAQLLVVLQGLRPGDVSVIRAHQQALSGEQIRAGEVDLFLAGIGDRVCGGDELHLVVLDQRFTLPGRGLLPLDFVLAVPELLGDILGDVDVEAAHRPVRVLQSQSRLIELRSDHDLVAAATTATAGGRREGQCDG